MSESLDTRNKYISLFNINRCLDRLVKEKTIKVEGKEVISVEDIKKLREGLNNLEYNGSFYDNYR